MVNKYLLILISLLTTISLASAQDFTCQWESNSCSSGFTPVFKANYYFNNGTPLVPLSSNVEINGAIPSNSNYNSTLCCSNMDNQVSFSTIPTSSSCTNKNPIMYFTNQTNARVGIPETGNPINLSYYNYKLCADLSYDYSSMDLITLYDQNEINKYKQIGYTCLFRASSQVNGVVSHCDATFGSSSSSYNIAVLGRLWENLNSLKCNVDCTSKLDGRVYLACSQKLDQCDIPPSLTGCDGSLLGGWAYYNDTHEVQCSAPWNNYRKTVFGGSSGTNKLLVETTDKCSSLIDKEYQVLIDNELVKMHVYICEN